MCINKSKKNHNAKSEWFSVHCCIVLALFLFSLRVKTPCKKGRKGKTRPKAFLLADVAWQSNNIKRIFKHKTFYLTSVVLELDWRKRRRIATTACVCVDVGRILLFSLDTIRMFEHFFVLYFDLSVTCCRCGIRFFYNRNTSWIYDYDYDVLKLNSWFTVLIWVGPGSAWKYGFSIIFSINRSIAQQN